MAIPTNNSLKKNMSIIINNSFKCQMVALLIIICFYNYSGTRLQINLKPSSLLV